MQRVKFNVIYFFEWREPAKFRNVTNTYNLNKYVERNIGRWSYANLYYSHDKSFFTRMYGL